MRIQHFTDCHIDINKRYDVRSKLRIDPSAHVIAITGDIFNHAVDTINWIKYDLCPQLMPHQDIVYIFGNHEFYDISIEKAIEHATDFDHPQVHFLTNGRVFEKDDVCFIGDTMWTDFEFISGRIGLQDLNMFHASQSMNDFSCIIHGDKLLKPINTVRFHNETLFWFKEAMRNTACKYIVILTHHAPSGKSVSPAFLNDSLNCAFVSDVIEKTPFPRDIALWMHGHVHTAFDYVIDGIRVVCSPLGYLSWGEGRDYLDSYVYVVGDESTENLGNALIEEE